MGDFLIKNLVPFPDYKPFCHHQVWQQVKLVRTFLNTRTAHICLFNSMSYINSLRPLILSLIENKKKRRKNHKKKEEEKLYMPKEKISKKNMAEHYPGLMQSGDF